VQIECALLTHCEVNRGENKIVVRFEVNMVVTAGITLFWDVTPRGLVCGHAHHTHTYTRLIGTYCNSIHIAVTLYTY